LLTSHSSMTASFSQVDRDWLVPGWFSRPPLLAPEGAGSTVTLPAPTRPPTAGWAAGISPRTAGVVMGVGLLMPGPSLAATGLISLMALTSGWEGWGSVPRTAGSAGR